MEIMETECQKNVLLINDFNEMKNKVETELK